MDNLLGPLDTRRRLRHPRNARPLHPLAPRPHRPGRIHVHARRPAPRRRQRAIPPPRHLQPHGIRRPRDRRPVRRPRPRPLPHGPLRLRRPLVLLPDRRLERLFPAAAGGEVGVEEVGRTEAVRGCGEQVANDAADRHGARQGRELQEACRAVRQG